MIVYTPVCLHLCVRVCMCVCKGERETLRFPELIHRTILYCDSLLPCRYSLGHVLSSGRELGGITASSCYIDVRAAIFSPTGVPSQWRQCDGTAHKDEELLGDIHIVPRVRTLRIR